MRMTFTPFSFAVEMIPEIRARSLSSSESTAMATNSSASASGWLRKSIASSKERSPQLSPSSTSMSSIRRSKLLTSREIVHATIGAGSGCKAATLLIPTRPSSRGWRALSCASCLDIKSLQAPVHHPARPYGRAITPRLRKSRRTLAILGPKYRNYALSGDDEKPRAAFVAKGRPEQETICDVVPSAAGRGAAGTRRTLDRVHRMRRGCAGHILAPDDLGVLAVENQRVLGDKAGNLRDGAPVAPLFGLHED